jgi:molybdopterin converting factor small subunit
VNVITVTVKFLGGVRQDMGMSGTTLSLPPNATLNELGPHLRALGIDPDSNQIIIILNDRGLHQWPADRRFITGDVVAIFPHISGG